MGWIGTVKQLFVKRLANKSTIHSAVVDRGGNRINSTVVTCHAGMVSLPLVNDQAVLIELQSRAGFALVGVYDTANEAQDVNPGEVLIYSRSENGTITGAIKLGNDGSIDLNGVVIDASGNITIPGTLDTPIGDYASHKHGTGSGDTTAVIPEGP